MLVHGLMPKVKHGQRKAVWFKSGYCSSSAAVSRTPESGQRLYHLITLCVVKGISIKHYCIIIKYERHHSAGILGSCKSCTLWESFLISCFLPFPSPIGQGPWPCQEVMEQPVTTIGSHSDFAPQQELVLTRQKDQQSDSDLSWQVGEHNWRPYIDCLTGWTSGLLEAGRGCNSFIRFCATLLWGRCWCENWFWPANCCSSFCTQTSTKVSRATPNPQAA